MEKPYEEFSESSIGYDLVIKVIENILRKSAESLINENKNSVTSFEEAEELYFELSYIQTDLKTTLFPNLTVDYDFGIKFEIDDWRDKILENAERAQRDDAESEGYSEYYTERMFETKSEDLAIDDLFTKQV